jgi:hypothetical protein
MTASIASDLWEVDYREVRYLAITLLEELSFKEILQQVEIWVMDSNDLELVKKLAKTLVTSWKEENFKDFSSTLKGWLQSNSIRRQVFALIVFQSVVQDADFSDLPLVFNLLRTHNIPANSALKRPFHDLLKTLIERSQPETARFLLDVLEKEPSLGSRLIRSVLEYFPTDQQARLKRALST